MSETLPVSNHFFEVQLELFTGPIDLLLHLVKANELPIEQISLAQVTVQYLQCIEKMRALDLEIAGEYLVIAATLLSIKASILLNEPVELVEDEEGNLVDPHQQLLERLREAEVFKDSAQWLDRLTYLGIDVFPPESHLDTIPTPPGRFKEHDPLLLGMAFKKLLEAAGKPELYTVTLESVSILERMMGVVEVLRKAAGPVVFYKLVPDLTSRSSIIGTLIALLELCKRQAISVTQDESFKEIMIGLSGEVVDTGNLTTEFDSKAEIVNG